MLKCSILMRIGISIALLALCFQLLQSCSSICGTACRSLAFTHFPLRKSKRLNFGSRHCSGSERTCPTYNSMLKSKKRKVFGRAGTELKETLFPWYTDPSIDRDRSNVNIRDIASEDSNTTKKNIILYYNGKVCIANSIAKKFDNRIISKEENEVQQPNPYPLMVSVDDVRRLESDLFSGESLSDDNNRETTESFLMDSISNTVIFLGTRSLLGNEDAKGNSQVEDDVSYWCIHIETNGNAIETRGTREKNHICNEGHILEALSRVLSLKDGSKEALANQKSLSEANTRKASLSGQPVFNSYEFINLREVGDILKRQDAALLATANALTEFHRSHKFCSRCGHPTVSAKAGGCRQCLNDSCTSRGPSRVYPRIDTATIMLITSPCGQYALLGRKANWPKGRYSTLAGFAEAGETLEHCVIREVFEESGVQVDLDSVKFIASQPWPFPRSLMVGFRGTALRDTDDTDDNDSNNKADNNLLPKIQHDENELEDVQWFHKEELAKTLRRSPGSTALGYRATDGEGLFDIPGRASLARLLVSHWVNEQ